jgi:hypothetical protein
MKLSWKALLLAALIGTAFVVVRPALAQEADDVEDSEVADDDYADEEAAFLLIKHHIATEPVVQGRNITVDLELHNVGNGTATEVTLHKAGWDTAAFELASGEFTGSWDEIKPKTGVTLQYVMVAKQSGPHQMPLLKVTYNPEPDSKLQVANGPRTPFYVLSTAQLWQRRALQAGSYASLGQIQTPAGWLKVGVFGGATVGIIGGYWLWNKASVARRQHKYNRAYAEVSKYE